MISRLWPGQRRARNAEPKSRLAGRQNPLLTYSIEGFVNQDTASVLTTTPSLATTATAASAPGTYNITLNLTGVSAANYQIIGEPATLTIYAVPSPSPLMAVAIMMSLKDRTGLPLMETTESPARMPGA